ncbi:MAG: GNAT family N-acetyltransferase, partial [Gloeomargarita sp. SKYG98]|nr:GNAT family N-acetyltransferase [Gloeomargarita sp. SKYG98]
GVGRFSRYHNSDNAEFAMIIADRYQCQGLGTELLRRLIEIARAENVRQLEAYMLPSNVAMRKICERLGFQRQPVTNDDELVYLLDLQQLSPHSYS